MPIERLKDGAQISYFDAGIKNAGAQTLVFIHGWGVSGDSFWPQHELAKKYRIIIPDLRGCGNSTSPNENYNIETLGNDIFELIEKLQLENVHLIAWSMGAMAIWLAMGKNECTNLKSVTIIDMSPRIDSDYNWDLGIIGYKSPLTSTGLERLEKTLGNMLQDWNNFAKRMVMRIFAKDVATEKSKEIYKKLFEIAKLNNPKNMAMLWRELSFCDARDNITKNNLPCLLVYGLNNQLYSNEVGKYVAQNMPNSYLVQFANSGHAPHLEEPASFNKILTGFVDSIDNFQKVLFSKEGEKGNGSFHAQTGQ